MHYILVDYENIQPDLEHLSGDSLVDVTVFVGASQLVSRKTDSVVTKMDDRAECIKLLKTGPNALDFHLVFHLGQLVLANPQASFEIISKDKGYDPLIEHLKAKGIHIVRTAEQYAKPIPVPKISKRIKRLRSRQATPFPIDLEADMNAVIALLQRAPKSNPTTIKGFSRWLRKRMACESTHVVFRNALIKHGFIRISNLNRITYLLPTI